MNWPGEDAGKPAKAPDALTESVHNLEFRMGHLEARVGRGERRCGLDAMATDKRWGSLMLRVPAKADTVWARLRWVLVGR